MKYRLQFNRSKRDCKRIYKQKIQGTGTISKAEGESKEGTNTDRLSQADHIHWTACGCSLLTAEKLVGDKDRVLVDPGLQGSASELPWVSHTLLTVAVEKQEEKHLGTWRQKPLALPGLAVFLPRPLLTNPNIAPTGQKSTVDRFQLHDHKAKAKKKVGLGLKAVN